MGLDGIDELVGQVLVHQLPVKDSAVEVLRSDDVTAEECPAQQAGYRGIQAGAGDEEIVMGAADGRHIGRIRQHRQPRIHSGIVRHGGVQLPLDGALAGPAVHELEIAGGVAGQQIGHGVAVDAPAPDDGDGVVGDIGAVPAPEIAPHQDADGGPRPGQGDQGAPLPLLRPDLLRRPGHGLRRKAGIPPQGVEIGVQIGLGRLVFQRQHL